MEELQQVISNLWRRHLKPQDFKSELQKYLDSSSFKDSTVDIKDDKNISIAVTDSANEQYTMNVKLKAIRNVKRK